MFPKLHQPGEQWVPGCYSGFILNLNLEVYDLSGHVAQSFSKLAAN